MDERTERSEGATLELPMVPLRDIVVFPHTMVPFVVGRKGSLLAVERALTALRETAGGEGNTMPRILDAVRAYATVGEIAQALVPVFGTYREVSVI